MRACERMRDNREINAKKKVSNNSTGLMKKKQGSDCEKKYKEREEKRREERGRME